MSARKSFLARSNFLYLGDHQRVSPIAPDEEEEEFEFDESDVVWNSNQGVNSSDMKNSIPNFRASKKPLKKIASIDRAPKSAAAATSLPVIIPDWSKILRGDHVRSRGRQGEVADDDDDEDDRIPPHVYLARTRRASLSVHEGIGRTLKGRDLSAVRNAVWKQTGFED